MIHLSKVLEKRGATEEALGRYNRACELAPTSALVMFKRTKVLVALRRYEVSGTRVFARIYLATAKCRHICSPPCSFSFQSNRSSRGGLTQLAVKDLLRLRDIAPDESNVAFMLGKVYRALGDSAKATQQFVIAQDLDPKLATNVNQLLKGELDGNDSEAGDQTMDQSEVG